MKDLLTSLRPKQWIKNWFIFLPIIFGDNLFNYSKNFKILIAFILFCMISSVVYLINDLVDLPYDKKHPEKRKRAIASGKISIRAVFITIIIVSAISLPFSFFLDVNFGWITITYLILNLLYSTILKKLIIIDVLCLGGFFLLRIIAGTIIAKVEYSHWMIFMTVLLAIFLGFNKRRQEIKHYKESAATYREVLSKYNTYFLDQMISVTTSSIVITYMIYTIDIRTLNLIGNNHLAYSIPFVYYGIFRYLYLVHKENKDGDPTNILISDKTMLVNLFVWIIVCVSVIYFKV